MENTKAIIISFVLAAILTVSSAQVVFAEDIVDSVGSSADDLTAGSDTTQGKTTEYEEETISSSTHNSSNSVTIYASKAGWATVSIPKVLVLGEDKNDSSLYSCTFKISVSGDISGAQSIIITPAKSVTLVETSGKTTSATASIALEGMDALTVRANDLIGGKTVTAIGKISVANLQAGSYSASFGIGIVIVN